MAEELGAVKGVVVEGIGDGPRQLPDRQIHPPLGWLAQEPEPQQVAFGFGGDPGELLEHRPHQVDGAPRIRLRLLFRALPISQQELHHPAEVAAREREPQMGSDPPQVEGQRFPQPAARGPGVDHHLHGFQGAWWGVPELGCQQLDQDLSPIAAVKRQQGPILRPPVRTGDPQADLGREGA